MNYLELKIAVLQKMFAITGNQIVNDDTTQPYLASIPQAANEGIDLIVQNGRNVRSSCVIHQLDTLPPQEELESILERLMKRMLDDRADMSAKPTEKIDSSEPFSADDLATIAGTLQAFRR